MKRLMMTVFLACGAMVPATASATETVSDEDSMTLGVGARIGGYGFREIDDGVLSWNDCRMNGTGLFGTLDFTDHFFGEVSADYYHAVAGQAEHEMDRVSFQPMVAVGARMMPGKLITPFIQAGGGPEFTRIQLSGVSENKVLGAGFMGIGGEVNLGQFHFGMNIRAFSMGLPKHLHGNTSAQALEPELGSAHDQGSEGEPAIAMKQEVAGQGQFTLRYTF